MNWDTFAFRVPDVQYPVAVSAMTIGSLKLSLLISRIFVKCKLRDVRNLAAVEPARGGLNMEAENNTLEEAVAGAAKEKAGEKAREKAIAVADKKIYSIEDENREAEA